MPKHLSIDIETYSSADLAKVGVYKYSESEDFEILLMGYAYDFGTVEVVDLTKGPMPEQLIKDLNNPDVIKHAYNAPFEVTCLNAAGYTTPPEEWRDTMLHALYLGYPAGLAATGKALGIEDDKLKDATGKALIRYFSQPCRATKTNGYRTRNLPHHDPEKWALYIEYNRQDVVAEMAIYNCLAVVPVPDQEQSLWVLEQRYNKHGIPIDLDLVRGALAIREEEHTKLMAEAKEITGLDNPKSRAQALQWVNEHLPADGKAPDLKRETVAGLIADNTRPTVTRYLKIYQELVKTSLAKYETFEAATAKDGNLHGSLQIYGANRTGRWAGRIIQPQNLPRISIPYLGPTRAMVKLGSLDGVQMLQGPNITDTLSQLIRTAIIASPGNKIISADFSAIEARILAWLAGETWVQEVFASTGKIYEHTASQMFGIDVGLIVKGRPEYSYRQRGKVATLALGYQGGVGALKAMGAIKMGIPETELPDIVRRWRDANPHIVAMWWEVEEAAMRCLTDHEPQTVGYVTFRDESPGNGLHWMTIELPSGRKLYYVDPQIVANDMGSSIIYQEAGYGGLKQAETYGGKLVENITQAIGRDSLAVALQQVASRGWQIITHIHDEIVLDVPKDVELAKVCQAMSEPIPWAPGLLLKADGFEDEYFRKG